MNKRRGMYQDGIHVKNNFSMSSGTLSVAAGDDALEAEAAGTNQWRICVSGCRRLSDSLRWGAGTDQGLCFL